MAASTSADSNNNYKYDVFISYKGPDVKKTFTNHLYRRLISCGLQVWLDRAELERGGDVLVPQIESAISSASVHVVILSPGYADPNWCLDELLLMLESRAPIIPVYYHVKPGDVSRPGQGVYARSLREHERKGRYDSTRIEKWRNALSQVAQISGFVLDAFIGDQAELLDNVVQAVLRRVKPEQRREDERVRNYVVGLGEKMKEFENKVLCEKLQVVGIVGVGGVGKTTLAKELFDQKRVNYSKYCFLPNVREEARLGFLISLQRQLLKTLSGTDKLINSIDEGKEELKKHLSSCSILIIIDDVDHLDQINALLPVQSRLFSDSLVVITSRDEGVIRSSGVENASIYQLTGLNHEHSQELFCAYAFNQSNPIEGFQDLVMNFLEGCEGLPLFLRVFGALLNDKNDQSIWKHLLGELQQVPQGKAQEKLQISYQNLNWEDQQIFLDSACFFIGQKRDTAITIWEGSGWKGHSVFRTLEDRCLLGVDEENNIEMHDHIRDFGRAVADNSSPRRLLHSNHIKHMLERLSDEQGTTVRNEPVTAVRGIRMVLGEDNDDVNAFGGVEDRILELDMRTLQLLHTDQHAILERILTSPMHIPSLIWLRWNKCPNPSLPSWIPMRNLRVLQVSGSELKTLWEDDSQPPEKLRELEINAPLSNIPESIGQLGDLESIVIGKFSSGQQVNLTKLPERFCHLRSLKDLVLTECSKMKSLPDALDGLRTLRHMDLSFCRNLERLPDSLGNLRQIQHINLSDCHDLVKLPDSIGRLWWLQHLHLKGCQHLESLPDSLGNLEILQHINLQGCHDLQRLPDSFGELRRLEHLDLQGCHNLEELPTTFGHSMNLLHINLSNCHNLERLPESIGYLRDLQHIDLSGCHNLERLPINFWNLKRLKYLDVEGCSNLIIDRFKIIEILDNLPEAHRSQLEQLYELEINAPLSDIPESIGQLLHLERIVIGKFSSGQQVNLTKFPEGFCHLAFLKDLVLTECSKIKSLPDALDGLRALRHMDLSFCRNLERLPDSLGKLVQLQHINLSDCHDLVKLPDSIGRLRGLQHLDIKGCHHLESLPDSLGYLENLRHINLSGCHDLQRLPHSFDTLRRLEHLDLQGCHNLVEPLTTYCYLPYLLHINLSNCHNLKRLPEYFRYWRQLEHIDLSGCHNLERLPDSFRHLNNLKYLDVEDCSNLIIVRSEIIEILDNLPEAHRSQLEQLYE